MPHRKRISILGCGRIAQRHAAEISRLAQPIAVCDINTSHANSLAAGLNAKAYYSLEQFLQEDNSTEIVAVCTPNGLHASQTIRLLNAGYHVICEKPMAISTADCNEMIAAAEQNDKLLFVVKQNRFNPPVAYVKRLLEEDRLGKIHAFQLNCFWNRPAAYFHDSWKGSLQLDGGTLYTQFSHFIDLVYWFFGDIKQASGIRKNSLHQGAIEFEDNGFAQLVMQSGAIGSIQYSINAHEKNMEGSLTIFGENGTIKIGGEYLNVLEYFSVKGLSMPVLPKGNHANQYGFYTGSMSNHDKFYENILYALDNKQSHLIQMHETQKAVEIIEKIYASSPIIEC